MDARLEALCTEFCRRFPQVKVRIDNQEARALLFDGPPHIGAVSIVECSDGFIVTVGKLTHGHFDGSNPSGSSYPVAEQVIDFVDDLMNDRVIVWTAGRIDGWQIRTLDAPPLPEHATTYLWSGPFRALEPKV
jgi:hypothetical protein